MNNLVFFGIGIFFSNIIKITARLFNKIINKFLVALEEWFNSNSNGFGKIKPADKSLSFPPSS